MSTTGEVIRAAIHPTGVLVLTLNRPTARNAVNDELAAALGAALNDFDADEALRVAVLTGEGGFCAGMDLKALMRGETGEHGPGGFAGIVREPPSKPVIAAVEGFALAGGFEVALACDLIVAASDARMGLPEVQRGLIADGGGLNRLARRIPRNVAMEMALTGSEVAVDRLYQLGLVNVVATPGQALAVALTLAQQVAGYPPLPVRLAKQVIRESRGWPIDEEWERQAEITAAVWASDAAAEGARAFTDKRPAKFPGD